MLPPISPPFRETETCSSITCVVAGSLGTTADQHALSEAVRGYATNAGFLTAARAAVEGTVDALPPTWPGLAAQELLALPFDGSAVDTCVAVEALGAALAAGPVVPTLVAALLVRRHGDDDLRATVEQGLRDGSMSFALQVDDVLVGGAAVSHLLISLDGQWSVVQATSVHLTSYAGIDPSRRVARLDEVVPDAAVVGRLPAATDIEVHEALTTLLTAEASGVAWWCVETAVDYAKVREQFGRPIGSFQAVKHRCADMLADLGLARAAAWDAANALEGGDQEPASRSLAVAVAAATSLEAAVECAKSCIQVLGGIGFTWEHDAHLYLKRALGSRQLVGGTAGWQLQAARLAGGGARRTRSVELGAEADGVRAEVREFLRTLDGLDDTKRRIAIADAGYLVPHWPVPYGRAAGPLEQLVIDEQFRAAGVARPDLVIGNWALPTILQYGTDEQRSRFAPPTLHGDISWCQMFSEPGAGSDLASLQTKATRVEGGWSLSGQKVWTSGAQRAHWAICLARTSSGEKRHHGITYFLVDMKSPGIDVRPLRELTGDALFNEIFLNDVFVPDDCVVGEVDGGWRLARTTLANERVAMSTTTGIGAGLDEVLAHTATDPVLDDRLGELLAQVQTASALGLRTTLRQIGGLAPGPASSVRKLVGMHHTQDARELALEVLGPDGALLDGAAADAARLFLSTRALTIAG